MLFYPIPQSLGCAAYVARITLARKFINDGTFLVGRHAILWPISIHNWVYIFHHVLSDPYSDVLCSEECQKQKLLVCCKMFPFFEAIFKFCTAKRCNFDSSRFDLRRNCYFRVLTKNPYLNQTYCLHHFQMATSTTYTCVKLFSPKSQLVFFVQDVRRADFYDSI